MGFKEEDGTLGDILDTVASSDLLLLLISDAAQVCPNSSFRPWGMEIWFSETMGW
jgi:hypothetical protein